MQKAIETAITDGLTVPENIQTAANRATANLYDGPSCGHAFAPNVDLVRQWLDELPTYYYCTWSGYLETGRDDESIELDSNDIARSLFGKLAGYL